MLHCCGVLLCISKVGALLSFHHDFYQVLPFFKLTLFQLTLSPRKIGVRTQNKTVALRLNLNLHQHRLLPPRRVMPTGNAATCETGSLDLKKLLADARKSVGGGEPEV